MRPVGLAAAALVLALAGCQLVQRPPEPTPSPSPTPVAEPSPTPAPEPQPVPAGVGEIEGELRYPSDFIPPLTVYAVSVEDPARVYALRTAQSDRAQNYVLRNVPPGEYVVFAYSELGEGLATGGYTRYVECGMTAACANHGLIRVRVADGQLTTGVILADWLWGEDEQPERPPGPPPFATGQEAEVRNRYADVINVRDAAGLDSTVLVALPNGTRVRILEGPVPADGSDWYRVSSPTGEGWVVGWAIRPVGEAEREQAP